MSSHGIPEEIENSVCSDYVRGVTSEQVARKHGISKSSVGNILKRRGIATRSPSERCAERDREVIALYQARATQREIAERLGLSQAGVG